MELVGWIMCGIVAGCWWYIVQAGVVAGLREGAADESG